jgi:MFS family permease
VVPTTQPANRRRLLLFICYVGFVSLGLPDPLIGVAWPSVRKTFGLEQSAVAWIFFGSGCSYFFSSFFAGHLLRLFNVGVLLALSSALVAFSGFDYSLARIWPLFVLGSLLHGLGSGAIDAGLNHYIANHFSARHMNWLHASYSLGAMLGPLLMTTMITWANSWRLGYLTVAMTLLALSFLFLATQSQWNDPVSLPAASPVESEPAKPMKREWRSKVGSSGCTLSCFFFTPALRSPLVSGVSPC